MKTYSKPFSKPRSNTQVSQVYNTTDAQGPPIYTDQPLTLPAQRLRPAPDERGA